MFIAECPSIPGCVSQGKSEQEAERNIREAIKQRLKVRQELGAWHACASYTPTIETRQVEVQV